MQQTMLRKAMKMAGLQRITPGMVGQFTLGEKIAAGMGGYWSLRGTFIAAVAFIGFPIFLDGIIDSFVPKKTLTNLDQIAELEKNNPVDVKIHVNFEEGVKVWTVKSRYFVTPVKGFEGRLYYCRKESHLEDEGIEEPIHVRGWAGKWKRGSWDVPALSSESQRRFVDGGMEVPKDAEILYDTDNPEGDRLNRWLLALFALIGLGIIWSVVNRAIRTFAALTDPVKMAEALNRRLGIDPD